MQDNLAELDKKLKFFQDQLNSFRESLESIKSFHADIQLNNLQIQEERFRTERLEEQINDLTELHQNEVENLKQAMADMEEKVQYQSEERLRDIHEMLEHCQTKVSFINEDVSASSVCRLCFRSRKWSIRTSSSSNT